MAPTNTCPQCGLRNRDGAKFCAHCGSQLGQPPMARKVDDGEALNPKGQRREAQAELFDVQVNWVPAGHDKYNLRKTVGISGDWSVAGRLRNTTRQKLWLCTLTVTIISKEGHPIHGFDVTVSEGVPPGQVRSFHGTVSADFDPRLPDGWRWRIGLSDLEFDQRELPGERGPGQPGGGPLPDDAKP